MTMLRKIALLPFFLSSCAVYQAQFSVPDRVTFQGKTYEKVTDNHIDEMQQMLYLKQGGAKNPDEWQQGILFFLDQNSRNKTLSQRAELRRQAFSKQMDTEAQVAIIENELRSQVLYPPTTRFQNYQLEVTRGRDLHCGYGQIQFSDKRSVSAKNLQKSKLAAYLRDLNQLALQFAQMPWLIECKK